MGISAFCRTRKHPRTPIPNHVGCQDDQSRYRRPVGRAKMCAVAPRSAEVNDGMNLCDHHVSRPRYARLRSRRIASASDPLSDATVQEPSIGVMAVKAHPPLRGPAMPTATPNEPLRTFIAETNSGFLAYHRDQDIENHPV